ncbi:MAG: efflux transporter outer membrane subunit [Caulobacteraceae bacterium]|nr:efflux transporter outer membrane subunit [Caulobacteraceae bacterium]
MLRPSLLATLLGAAALSACTLDPHYERPALPVSQAWPVADRSAAGAASAGDLAWREVFADTRLQGLITLALSQNRDLRVSMGNIAKARAAYGVQRANLLPTVNAAGAETRSHTPASVSATGRAVTATEYTANVGVSAYEIDLFGRLRSLSRAALQSYLATEEDLRTAQITLVSEVAGDYLSLAADQDQLKLSQDTLASREDSLRLTKAQFAIGSVSQVDVRLSETLVEQARADTAKLAAQVEQGRNALRLVVGAEIPKDLEPQGDLEAVQIRGDLPAGTPSDVLARRPDVLSAEYALKAQNADIGAARAAFFPKISLTGSAGSASTDLGKLFAGGAGAWSFAPQISAPLFAGGANISNLRQAKAGRDIAVATYEKAVQTAFREVSDALAVKSTIDEQLQAQTRLTAAAADSLRLTQARYDRGIDSYPTLLDAKRTLYSDQQTLITTQLSAASNRVTLYKVLGGGVR